MPLGSYSLTYHYADQLCKHRPKSVLDLGIGFGLQGCLVRQYMDGGVMPWKTTLIGVEAFEGYRNPAWNLYDRVLIGSIQHYLEGILPAQSRSSSQDWYDFIILSDVLEHFDKEEGMRVIKTLMGRLNKGGVLMIGTPGVWAEQDAVHGNEYEIHRSLWKWNEFPSGFDVIKNGEPDEFQHRMILVKYVKK